MSLFVLRVRLFYYFYKYRAFLLPSYTWQVWFESMVNRHRRGLPLSGLGMYGVERKDAPLE